MAERKITLVHATPLAIEPVASAFAAVWPQATCMNLLEDRLSQDRAAAGRLDASLARRLAALARYGAEWGAQGILFTCSAFGPAIDAIARELGRPVLKPNEAMFEAALAHCAKLGGRRRVGLLTTFAPATASMAQEFAQTPGAQAVELVAACAEGAMAALAAGDRHRHDSLLLAQAVRLAFCDVVMLGQFSMAASRPLVERALPCPILTSPESAVLRLRSILEP